MRINNPRIVSILFAMLIALPLFAEPETNVATFIKKVKGFGDVTDAIQTTDGNYVSISTANGVCIVRKSSASGKRIWEKMLSVQVHPDEGGYWFLTAIAQTNDGYVLVGYTADNDLSLSGGVVVTLHSDGTLNWNKRFNISGNLDFSGVNSTPDGGFIVTGGAYPPDFHPILVKFTSEGSIQWQKAFETLSFPFLSQSTSDNGLIVAAQNSNGAEVIKIDYLGNIVWRKILEIVNFSLQALGYAPNNGVIVAGRSTDSTALSLTGLNSKGKIAWKAKYSLSVAAFSISHLTSTLDGGLAVTGGTGRSGYLLKINVDKSLAFQKAFGAPRIVEEGRFVFSTGKEGFVLLGSSRQNLLFLRLNSKGIAPGCAFFHQLNSEAVSTGDIKVSRSIVSSQTAAVPTESSFEVETKDSRHSLSTICE